MTRVRTGACVLLALGVSLQAPAQTPSNALRIVVIEGEGAVNVIQQRSAVAPMVEVRDRNDQPVAGAVVRFAIRTGRASFNGARTLSVTTNAAGRAAAASLTPTGSGALQISASAAFQGQTAAITIAQTNVMTLAQATAVGAGGTSGGATSGAAGGGAAGGGGGGLSATTIGIVGGAAVGGTIVAKEVAGGPATVNYGGTFEGTFTDRFGTCTRLEAHSGTMTIALAAASDGAASGDANVSATSTGLGGSNCPAATLSAVDNYGQDGLKIKGTTGNLTFTANHAGLLGTTWYFDFAGVLNNEQITGTFTLRVTHTDGAPDFIAPFPVTLTKQGQ